MDDTGSDRLPTGTTLKDLTVERVLGQGGFGITYAAWDNSLQKRFCLKEFFPQGLAVRNGLSVRASTGATSAVDFKWARDRFFAEARTLAQLKHPNIVDVIRVFEANNTVYMQLRHVEGKTFEHWLKSRTEEVTQRELSPIVDGILSALEAVHANNTLHLDISPDNVMIQEETNTPVLLDFGAARIDIQQHSQLLSAILFKHGYSAPEQYTSSVGQYGPWTDIYALGATLYRAVTGRRPHDAPSRQLGERQNSAMVAAARRFDARFLLGIDRAMQLKPDDRPRSVAALRALLTCEQPARRWPVELADLEGWKEIAIQKANAAVTAARALPRPAPEEVLAAGSQLAREFARWGRAVAGGVLAAARALTRPQQAAIAGGMGLLLATGSTIAALRSDTVPTSQPDRTVVSRVIPFADRVVATETLSVPVQLASWKRNRTRGSIDLSFFVQEKPYFEALGLGSDARVQIASVIAGGAAERAGLKMGDIILSWNGEPVRSTKDLFDRMVPSAPDTTVTLEVLRVDGQGSYFDEIVRRAELGKPHLMYHVGLIYRMGAQIQRNDTQAFQWFEKAAQGGDISGMWALALAHFRGEGTKIDNTAGLYWLMRAADTGDANMQYGLGVMLLDGPVPRDEAKAVDLLQRAASAGNGRAMLRVGQFHQARRSGEAVDWYERAAKAGDSDAMVHLGLLHTSGYAGVNRNLDLALDWYGKAMRQHHRTAFYNAALIRDDMRQSAEAAQLLMRALEMGEPLAFKQMTDNWRRWKRATRAELQRLFAVAGLYSGRMDGEFGPDMLAAVRAYGG